jgi:hypothetical protein
MAMGTEVVIVMILALLGTMIGDGEGYRFEGMNLWLQVDKWKVLELASKLESTYPLSLYLIAFVVVWPPFLR